MKHLRLVSGMVFTLAAVMAGPNTARADCNNANGSCFSTTNSNTGPRAVGIFGQVNGNGTAVWGQALHNGYGVYGEGDGADAIGVEGFNNSNGPGVKGISTSNYGVFGYSPSSIGVVGVGDSGVAGQSNGSGAAVAGTAFGTGLAGFFFGSVQVTRDLTVSGTFHNPSDSRLKEDVQDARYGLAEVMRLRPVSFKWKDGRSHDVQRGFIAQEVQKVFPDLVSTDSQTGMLQLNSLGFIPVAIKAIRDQQQVIQRLETRLTALESERRPVGASLAPGRLGGALALGLVPLGLLVGHRRRRDRG
jgi:hypothetical protein